MSIVENGRSDYQILTPGRFYPTAQQPEWAIRWGLNVYTGRDDRWGANAAAHSMGHSFEALVPVAKHFAAHPECFSLVDGRRRDRMQQLRCTNPHVADAAAETMAGWIRDNPHQRIFAVGMSRMREIRMSASMSGDGRRSMAAFVRHRRPKGPTNG